MINLIKFIYTFAFLSTMITLVQSSNISLEKFVEHYPRGTIRFSNLNEIPAEAMKLFEGYSRRFINPNTYSDRNFDNSFTIIHDAGYITHVVSQEKKYDTSKTVEKLLYVYDMMLDHTKIGHGEIRFDYNSKSRFFASRPFVGFSSTEENFREEGFGTNRLRFMNALSYMFFNLPLNSDSTITGSAEKCWEKLVLNNEAKRYQYKIKYEQDASNITRNRFVFII